MMNTIQIELDAPNAAYLPGSTLTGTLRWELDSKTTEIAVRLLYHTEGRGTEESETLDEHTVPTPSATGSAPFSFKLPLSPLSFSGELITLKWAIEAVSQPKQKCIEHQLFILSPTLETIVLPRIENPATAKKKSRWRSK